jgi:hypothetical protein
VFAKKFVAAIVEDGEASELLEVSIDVAAVDFALGGEHRSLSHMILFPLPQSFLLLKDATDFYLVAGPKALVESILGTDFEAAWGEFEAEAQVRAGDAHYVDLRPIAEEYHRAR